MTEGLFNDSYLFKQEEQQERLCCACRNRGKGFFCNMCSKEFCNNCPVLHNDKPEQSRTHDVRHSVSEGTSPVGQPQSFTAPTENRTASPADNLGHCFNYSDMSGNREGPASYPRIPRFNSGSIRSKNTAPYSLPQSSSLSDLDQRTKPVAIPRQVLRAMVFPVETTSSSPSTADVSSLSGRQAWKRPLRLLTERNAVSSKSSNATEFSTPPDSGTSMNFSEGSFYKSPQDSELDYVDTQFPVPSIPEVEPSSLRRLPDLLRPPILRKKCPPRPKKRQTNREAPPRIVDPNDEKDEKRAKNTMAARSSRGKRYEWEDFLEAYHQEAGTWISFLERTVMTLHREKADLQGQIAEMRSIRGLGRSNTDPTPSALHASWDYQPQHQALGEPGPSTASQYEQNMLFKPTGDSSPNMGDLPESGISENLFDKFSMPGFPKYEFDPIYDPAGISGDFGGNYQT